MARICWRCSRKSGLFGGFDQRWESCGPCAKEIKNELAALRSHFDVPDPRMATRSEAQDHIAHYVRRAAETKRFVPDESTHIRGLALILGLDSLVYPCLTNIEKSSIQSDNMPAITPSIALGQNETCYIETPALHQTSRLWENGTIVLTNRRFLFILESGTGAHEVALNKFLRTSCPSFTESGLPWMVHSRDIRVAYPRFTSAISVEFSQKNVSGRYGVDQPGIVVGLLEAVVQKYNRQGVPGRARDTRAIPPHVRSEVWQRDDGRCVECGATEYLEFDHIIPHAKGGATSVNNLQLLCRKCNLGKSDRI